MLLKLSLILTITMITACSSNQKNTRGLVVTPAQDVVVMNPKGEETKVEKGKPHAVQGQSLLFQKPGHVSVLLVPTEASTGSIDLNLKPIKEFGGPELDRFIDIYLTQLMTKVTQVQESMAGRNYTLALQKIKSLQVEYPNLVYLQFLEASCLTLMGEKSEAQRVLTRALEVHPDNPEGRRLDRYLSGGRSRE